MSKATCLKVCLVLVRNLFRSSLVSSRRHEHRVALFVHIVKVHLYLGKRFIKTLADFWLILWEVLQKDQNSG